MPMITEDFFRTLADPTRLRCLLLLAAEDELCVCEFIHALDEVQPKISRHLATLREAGIVSDRRAGQWVHYRLHPDLPAWARQVLTTTLRANRATAPYARDLRRLETMADRPAARCSA
jgi:ArsR family transcriptional regulator